MLRGPFWTQYSPYPDNVTSPDGILPIEPQDESRSLVTVENIGTADSNSFGSRNNDINEIQGFKRVIIQLNNDYKYINDVLCNFRILNQYTFLDEHENYHVRVSNNTIIIKNNSTYQEEVLENLCNNTNKRILINGIRNNNFYKSQNVILNFSINTKIREGLGIISIDSVNQAYIDYETGYIYSEDRTTNKFIFIRDIGFIIPHLRFPDTFYGINMSVLTVERLISKLYELNRFKISNGNINLQPIVSYHESREFDDVTKKNILQLHYITTDRGTQTFFYDMPNIEFHTNFRCMIYWSVQIQNGFSDINHLCAVINFGQVQCRKCCTGLKWYQCGLENNRYHICKDSEDCNSCVHKIWDNKHNCSGAVPNDPINYNGDRKKEDCLVCGMKNQDIETKKNNSPAVSKYKKIIELIPDLFSWSWIILMSNLNFIISLSIIDLDKYSVDYTGFSDETFIGMFSTDDKLIFGWNIAILLIVFPFLLLFIRREMSVIHILIENQNDKLIDHICRNNNIKGNGDITSDNIVTFKKMYCDLSLLLGHLLLSILCIISIAYVGYLGPNNNILIFTILIIFKVKFLFNCFTRCINLNMYRICSADKYKTSDLTKDLCDKNNKREQKGDNARNYWLFYYFQNR